MLGKKFSCEGSVLTYRGMDSYMIRSGDENSSLKDAIGMFEWLLCYLCAESFVKLQEELGSGKVCVYVSMCICVRCMCVQCVCVC